MSVVAYRVKCQNFLLQTVADNPLFYEVTYDANRFAVVRSTPVVPVSVLCNEVRASFREAKSFRRYEARDRDVWTFQLKFEFDKEVTLERFEDWICNPVLTMKRNASGGYDRQVQFDLISTTYQHPQQQEHNTGTRAVMVIQAEFSPMGERPAPVPVGPS